MRSLAVLLVVPCLFALAAHRAEAHGGGGFRGPSGVPPPPPETRNLSCICAQPCCPRCSDPALHPASTLLVRPVERTASERWDDFEAVRITIRLRAPEGSPPLEAYLSLDEGALFAATGGRIDQGGATLEAALVPALEARSKYLWARARGLDPFLLMREGPGRLLLRAYPVRVDGETVVTFDGYSLAAARRRGGTRLYRTGERILAVSDVRGGAGAGDFADDRGGRALAFLPLEEARGRFGAAAVEGARVVPFVHAIETAASGAGAAASSNDAVLTALPADAEMPPKAG